MEKETVFITKSSTDTQNLGEKLAHNFKAGDIVILHGELGSGKTTFVQGVARKFGVKTRIISPTFVLVRRHEGTDLAGKNILLYHIDLYRLDTKDVGQLGLQELFEDTSGVFFIEWGKKINEIKPSWEITIDVIGKGSRKIKINRYE
jgi:tRNA threonylcarbamoyladenosine biosynthesis protein TsaE